VTSSLRGRESDRPNNAGELRQPAIGPVIDRQGDRQMVSGPRRGATQGRPRLRPAFRRSESSASAVTTDPEVLMVHLTLSPDTDADAAAGHVSEPSQDAWRAGGAGVDPRRSRPRHLDKAPATKHRQDSRGAEARTGPRTLNLKPQASNKIRGGPRGGSGFKNAPGATPNAAIVSLSGNPKLLRASDPELASRSYSPQ
jgi:hypothetical protein